MNWEFIQLILPYPAKPKQWTKNVLYSETNYFKLLWPDPTLLVLLFHILKFRQINYYLTPWLKTYDCFLKKKLKVFPSIIRGCRMDNENDSNTRTTIPTKFVEKLSKIPETNISKKNFKNRDAYLTPCWYSENLQKGANCRILHLCHSTPMSLII